MHPESTASVTAEPRAVLEGVSIPQCLAESAAEAASARAGVGGGRVRVGLSAVLEMSSSRGVSRREKSDRRPPWIRSPREVALESAPHATSDGSAARYSSWRAASTARSVLGRRRL